MIYFRAHALYTSMVSHKGSLALVPTWLPRGWLDALLTYDIGLRFVITIGRYEDRYCLRLRRERSMMSVALAIVNSTRRAGDDIMLFLRLFTVRVPWNRFYWVQGSTAPTIHWELAIVTLKVCGRVLFPYATLFLSLRI